MGRLVAIGKDELGNQTSDMGAVEEAGQFVLRRSASRLVVVDPAGPEIFAENQQCLRSR